MRYRDGDVHAVSFSTLVSDITDRLADAQNVDQVSTRFIALIKDCGPTHFLTIELPTFTGDCLRSRTILTNWPAPLVATFDKAITLCEWPIIQSLHRKVGSHSSDWSRPRGCDTVAMADLSEMLRETGLIYSNVFYVHDMNGRTASVILSGRVPISEVADVGFLQLVSNIMFNRLVALRVGSPPDANISVRELECLRWTGEGKTSGEIAKLLGLSEHTVNHHLLSAGRKLGASNRTNSVIRAVRRGILSL